MALAQLVVLSAKTERETGHKRRLFLLLAGVALWCLIGWTRATEQRRARVPRFGYRPPAAWQWAFLHDPLAIEHQIERADELGPFVRLHVVLQLLTCARDLLLN